MRMRRWLGVIGAGALVAALLAVTVAGLGPWRARLLTKDGAALLSQGRYVSAARTLAQAVALAPADAHAHFQLGLAYAELGERAAALGHFEDAVRLAPRRAQYEIGLAGLLLDAGRFPEAIPHLRAALALEPHAADIRLLMAETLRRAGDRAGMSQEYGTALRLAGATALGALAREQLHDAEAAGP
jgi:tetratricopeptide (TPR) repeat protein